MDVYISFSENQRKKFFNILKEKINCSWENFYPNYKISRSMFFNYLSGRYFIPKNLFLDWKKIVDDSNIIFVENVKVKYLPKKIPKIIFDENLAEILGILNGDGHVSKFKHEICVVGDLKEKDYFDHLKKLFEKKFKLAFTLRKEDHAFKLRCYSKDLSNLLVSEYRLPKGNKMGKLKIPKQVFASEVFIKGYIRGLYDTDGSLYFRRKNEPVIQITSADPLFLKEVHKALSLLGFSVSKGNQRIFIYKKEQIKRFFSDIKPANSKHLKKYQSYINS